jgi:hypothetical protein
MAETVSIELRCSKTSDNKYTARTYVNGKEKKEKEFIVNRSDEFAVVQLYQRVKKAYPGVEPTVKGLDKHAMDSIQRNAP